MAAIKPGRATPGDIIPLSEATIADHAIAVPVEVPFGIWQRDASHHSQPFTPAARSIVLPAFNAAAKEISDEFGLLAGTSELREIGGWAYRGLVPLGGKDGSPPRPEMLTERIEACVRAVQEDRAGQSIEQWHRNWQPDLARRIGELRDISLTELSDGNLDAQMSKAVALFSDGIRLHFYLAATYSLAMYDLFTKCEELLGWDEGHVLQLVIGLSTKSTEPAHRLSDLARLTRERPNVVALLAGLGGDDTGDDVLAGLQQANPEFAQAFADYQKEYGIRALSFDVAEHTLVEKPEATLRLVYDQVRQGYDPVAEMERLAETRKAARAEAIRALAGQPAGCSRFEQSLARAERAYPVREDNEFFTISAPLALARFAMLEMGQRLAKRGAIEQAEDVFFLEMEEARAALLSHHDQQPLVKRRRRERAWVEAHPGPDTYGVVSIPPVPQDSLPAEVRFVSAALAWALERFRAPAMSARAPQKGTRLVGLPASQGRYTGVVRVILDESEFSKICLGDVLVCPSTSPVWSVIFPSVGALVTDTGGILSHPAIIAREYGIPAVVATGNATELLQDGQLVTVDGTAGLVEVHLS